MITFRTNDKTAIPITEYDRLQKLQLEKITQQKKSIVGFSDLTSYDPNETFKNVYRENEDGTIDLIISPEVVREISSGSLAKRTYKAMRLVKKEGFIKKGFSITEFLIVPERDIISQFERSFDIKEIETLLEQNEKKGGQYFG